MMFSAKLLFHKLFALSGVSKMLAYGAIWQNSPLATFGNIGQYKHFGDEKMPKLRRISNPRMMKGTE